MKKKMKMLAAILLSSVMAVSASVTTLGTMTAQAASIAVQNVVDGETYTAYKILNYRDNGGTGENRAVSYYLSAAEYTAIGSVLETAGFSFTASSDGSEYFVDNGASLDAEAVAEALSSADLSNALGTATATGANGSANFSGLGTGYYFVTSSAGSLCALHEDTDIANVVEKNTIPTIDKTEKTTGDEYVDGPLDANIGDTVHYQIVITDGIGTNAELTMTDTMTAGLTYNAGTLKINGTAVADDADTDNWKVTVSGRTITIVFSSAYMAALDTAGTITVTYDATINKDAVIDNATGNENKVEMVYSAQHQEDTVYVATYDFQVFKTDGTAFLDGAEFKLYDAETDGHQILLSKDDTGYYLDANGNASTTIDINATAGCNVRGLAPGTYYLEEVVVPNGYNKLDTREAVTITTGAAAAVEITVENSKGTTLPTTGGIGTTIFYVVGGSLVGLAVVLLITKRRMNAKEK
ncbi:MAG: SpaH/EbpB family LPXTG-anchored major pilin [Oscillospiraceae bacterium]|nr:SpaH/EbpB family LPXTG-anchored major pilin [Oscillospiraceae bacterium]